MISAILMFCTSSAALKFDESQTSQQPLQKKLSDIANHEGISVGAIICSSQHISAIYKGIGPRKWIKRGELGRGSIATLPPAHPFAAGRDGLLGVPLSAMGAVALDSALRSAATDPALLSAAVGEELAKLLQVQKHSISLTCPEI
jgi:hypothetical protein